MVVTARFHTSTVPSLTPGPPTSTPGSNRDRAPQAAGPSTALVLVEDPVPLEEEPLVSFFLVEERPLGFVPTDTMPADTPELLVTQVFQSSDVLVHLFGILGLRHFTHLSSVNRLWRDAVDAKYREWGLLAPVGTIGKGHGRLRGQLDMPTHCTMLPSGHVVVVDSCNERLVEMAQDGAVVNTVGRPGARRGQLSSPSGAVCVGDVLYATSLLQSPGAAGAVSQHCILKLSLPSLDILQQSPLGPNEGLDAPEGMAVAANRLFVVDQAQHTIAAFDAERFDNLIPQASRPIPTHPTPPHPTFKSHPQS